MAPHSSTLAWKIPWVEEPGRLQSMGSLPASGPSSSVSPIGVSRRFPCLPRAGAKGRGAARGPRNMSLSSVSLPETHLSECWSKGGDSS